MIGMKDENSATVASIASEIPAWQQRVIEEKEQLNVKIGKLAAFLAGEQFPKLPITEQNRLSRQLFIMQDYRSVLNQRIEAWSDPVVEAIENPVEVAVEAESESPGTVSE